MRKEQKVWFAKLDDWLTANCKKVISSEKKDSVTNILRTKITNYRSEFHQHITCDFFVQSFARSFFVITFEVWTFLASEYWRKCGYKMLVKLTARLSQKIKERKDENPSRSISPTYISTKHLALSSHSISPTFELL